eukprot:TRINITY_DN22854_c0_g1_i1.p1 TRINITY_DN22854_c0_g1~~TRINITY_DN22854_c0_g1_i1.p1  ORF type:complete len:194 (-),score=32.88 TRINITY_DN22854_c0_g1_i1:66-647(-)
MSLREDEGVMLEGDDEGVDVPNYLRRCPKCRVLNDPLQVEKLHTNCESKESDHQHVTMKLRFACLWCKRNYQSTFELFDSCPICWGRNSSVARQDRNMSFCDADLVRNIHQETPTRASSRSMVSDKVVESSLSSHPVVTVASSEAASSKEVLLSKAQDQQQQPEDPYEEILSKRARKPSENNTMFGFWSWWSK